MGKMRQNPSRDEMKDFLRAGIDSMNSDCTRALLRDQAVVEKPGDELIKLQRGQWEPLGIDANGGCKALEQINDSDKELIALRDDFVATSMRIYLRSLEDRKPAELERTRPLPREVIMEFMNACNTKMDLPEFREALMLHLKEGKGMPNQLIIEAQRDLLEVMGWERDHGCAELSKVARENAEDKEIMQSFGMWQHKAQHTMTMVVKQYQATGGDLPMGPHMEMPEELKKLHEEAVAALESMSLEEKQESVKKFQKKFEIFMNLPPEGRQSYIQKLANEDRLEFAKARLLIVSMMRQQWEFRNSQAQAMNAGMGIGPNGEATKPTQQQMM